MRCGQYLLEANPIRTHNQNWKRKNIVAGITWNKYYGQAWYETLPPHLLADLGGDSFVALEGTDLKKCAVILSRCPVVKNQVNLAFGIPFVVERSQHCAG